MFLKKGRKRHNVSFSKAAAAAAGGREGRGNALHQSATTII